jgi:hypothetical protein
MPAMYYAVHLYPSTIPDIPVGIETRQRAGRLGFNSRQELGIFLFATASRPAL